MTMNGFSTGDEDFRDQESGEEHFICCLIDNGQRCPKSASNASYNKRIEKTVTSKKLQLIVDPQSKHCYICEQHKSIIQNVRIKKKRRDSDDDDNDADNDVPEIDFYQLQVNTLRRYKRHFKVTTKPGLNKAQLVESSGIKISKDAVVYRAKSVTLSGKNIFRRNSIIRSDLGSIRIGRYCIFGENTIIRPSFAKKQTRVEHHSLSIGDYVFINDNSVINAKSIGSYVYIGKNVVVGRNCVLNDCCRIDDNTVLAPGTIVPSFAIIAGNPYKTVGSNVSSFQYMITSLIEDFYDSFK